MSILRIEDLDRYSRIAVPLVLKRFPQWERYLSIHPRNDGLGSVARFAVPCTNDAVDSGLGAWTDDDEFTVGFHTHHSHFTDYDPNPTYRDMIACGLDYAADILADRIGVISHYSAGGFMGSSSVDLPAEAPDKILAKAPPFLQEHYARADAVTIRSWSGRFDRNFGDVGTIRRYP